MEPNVTSLNKMDHAPNAPILDIVVMHSAVTCTADNELETLQRIQRDQMISHKWSDISVHYLIGPSGKVYEGRDLRYRADGTVGSGMGRFGDNWGKCAIMLLGNFNSAGQALTPEAQSSLNALIEDRKEVFERRFKKALEVREAETKSLMGQEGPFGFDQVRIHVSPSLPKGFLDQTSGNNKADGGTQP